MLKSFWEKFMKQPDPSSTEDKASSNSDASVPQGTPQRNRSLATTLVGLIVIVVGANVLIHVFHHHHNTSVTPADDTYTLTGSPLTAPEATLPTALTPMEQELHQQEAKLKALQAVQAAALAQQQQQSSQVLFFLNHPSASTSNPSSSSFNDVNQAFMANAQQNTLVRVSATHDTDLSETVSQGTLIDAVLAVAIDSDLPGQIEAIVSHDVYGDTGETVLIPKGSRLIGRYLPGSSFRQQQSRLFVVWDRVLEPNGIVVPLASPGTDALGEAGVTGSVDYHFFARFGSAILTSLLSTGAATYGVSSGDQYNSADAYRQSVSQALANQSGQMLQQSQAIPPTIHVPQGTRIQVFVNKNIDFKRVFDQLGTHA